MDEFNRKIHGLQQLYPGSRFSSKFFGNPLSFTYRFVVDEIEATPYADVVVNDFVTATQLCLSAVKELKRCHKKSLIMLKLTFQKILYRESDQKSFILASRFNLKKGDQIPGYFKDEKSHIYNRALKLDPTEIATESLDVYALGGVLIAKVKHLYTKETENHPLFKWLIKCIAPVDDRTTLNALENGLSSLLQQVKKQEAMDNTVIVHALRLGN